MPEEKAKFGKLSNFFRSHHFGKQKENPEDKPSLAKNKEETPKMSVKKTFKKALLKVTNPVMKILLKTSTKEDFEKALSKIGNIRIKMMSPIHAAILYVKFLQLYGANNQKVIMKGTPQSAARDIQGISNGIAKTDGFKKDTTKDKLTELSRRILSITPLTWKPLIKIIDNSFDQNDDAAIVELANTKSNMSDTQTKSVIQKISSGEGLVSPSTNPTSIKSSSNAPQSPNVAATQASAPNKEPTLPSATPTSIKSSPNIPQPPNVAAAAKSTSPKKAAQPVAQGTKKSTLTNILGHLLSCLTNLNASVGKPNQPKVFSEQTSKIKNIQHHLTTHKENLEKPRIKKLIEALDIVLEFLNGQDTNKTRINDCINYFIALPNHTKNAKIITLSKQIATRLKFFFTLPKPVVPKIKQTSNHNPETKKHEGLENTLTNEESKNNIQIGSQGQQNSSVSNEESTSTNTAPTPVKPSSKERKGSIQIGNQRQQHSSVSNEEPTSTNTAPSSAKSKKDSPSMWGNIAQTSSLWGDQTANNDLLDRLRKMNQQSQEKKSPVYDRENDEERIKYFDREISDVERHDERIAHAKGERTIKEKLEEGTPEDLDDLSKDF